MSGTMVLVGGCVVALIVLGVVAVGLIMVTNAGRRDTVSTARQDWIQRRSENDERGW